MQQRFAKHVLKINSKRVLKGPTIEALHKVPKTLLRYWDSLLRYLRTYTL